MPALDNSKHEHFAQFVAKGVTASEAYVSAGYSKAGARVSGSRLLTNANVSARIKELQAEVSAGVVAVEIRKRSARVAALQTQLNGMLELQRARAAMYTAAGEEEGGTGLVVKDYRGKDANQVVWKFDNALVAAIRDTLKQVAIEEGQWTEKRDFVGSVPIAVRVEFVRPEAK